MKIFFRVFPTLLLAVFALPTWAAPTDLSIYESFEGISPNTSPGVSFDIGNPLEKATFSGNAFAGVVGQGVLYNQSVTPGNKSWMVMEGSIGRIDFDINAAEVEFFARAHPSADGNTIIRAFDSSNTLIGSEVSILPGEEFASVSFSGNIDYILVDNQATNIMNGIDDFGFTAVPEPSSILLGGIALLGAVVVSSRRRIRR